MTVLQESRSRSRIYAPPRSAVPVPGEGSVFGRGFLRRWRKSEGGCFFLPFLAVGLAIFTFGALGTWGPYKESLRANPFSIYEQIREIPPAGDRLKELPVAFDLPPDLPGTDLGRPDATYWQVVLQIPVAGPNFETVFLAPVYEATEAPPSWKS